MAWLSSAGRSARRGRVHDQFGQPSDRSVAPRLHSRVGRMEQLLARPADRSEPSPTAAWVVEMLRVGVRVAERRPTIVIRVALPPNHGHGRGRGRGSESYEGEIGNDYSTRLEGTRIKQSMGPVAIKMDDKFELVLWAETTGTGSLRDETPAQAPVGSAPPGPVVSSVPAGCCDGVDPLQGRGLPVRHVGVLLDGLADRLLEDVGYPGRLAAALDARALAELQPAADGAAKTRPHRVRLLEQSLDPPPPEGGEHLLGPAPPAAAAGPESPPRSPRPVPEGTAVLPAWRAP